MAIVDIWSIINPIKDELQKKAWQIVNDVSNKVWQIVNAIVDSAKAYISGVIYNVGNMLNNALNAIRNTIDNVRTILENKINDIVRSINNVINQIVNTISDLKTAFTIAFNNFKYAIENKINDVKYTIETTVNNVVNRGITIITGFIDRIKDTVENLTKSITNIKNTIVDTITAKVGSLAIDISNRLKETYDTVTHKINNYINQAKDIISEKIEYVRNNLNIIKDRIESKINDTREYIQRNIDEIRERITNKINQVKDDLSKGIEIAIDKIRSKFESVQEDIREFIDNNIKALRDRIDKLVADIKLEFESLLKSIDSRLDEWREVIGNELDARFDAFSHVFTKVSNGQYNTYDEFIKDFNAIGGSGGILSVLIGMIAVGSTYLNSVITVGQPFTQNIRTLAMSEALPTVLSPAVISRAYTRGWVDLDFFNSEMSANGVNDKRSDVLYQLEKEITSPGEAQVAFLRGLITEDRHDNLLQSWGFTEEKIALLKQLYFIIPPISDIITMSVREVFSPQTAEKFGQFEDFPSEFASFAMQQGLSEEWAKRYWASHWSLPSPTQGFEMLHRRIIDKDELTLLLKALDIMPFWRERLIKLSFNPLTRVDVRRMHKMGVLTENEVYESYLDIGYDEENARRLTEFTVKLNASESSQGDIEVRQLTRNIIEQAYRQGIVSKDNAINRLMNIGYTLSDTEFLIQIQDSLKQIESSPEVKTNVMQRTIKMVLSAYATRTFGLQEALGQLIQLGMTQLEASTELSMIDYEINTKLKQRYVDSIQELYTNWVIDSSQLFIYLNDLGFSQGEISMLLTELDIIRNTRTKMPSMTDLKRWVNGQIITIEQYINDLKGLGYPDVYIERYVAELGVIE